MPSIRHDAEKGTTWLTWRAGGRGGRQCSATFETKGGRKRGAGGWQDFADALEREGHPADAPAGWVKYGRRWQLDDAPQLDDRETLETYGNRWLREEQRGANRHRRDSRVAFETHVVPALGSLYLDEIRPRDVKRWQAGLERKLSSSSIRNMRSVLGQIMVAAVEDELADSNPVAAVKAPEGGREHHSAIIPIGDVATYLSAARAVDAENVAARTRDRDPHFADMVELFLRTGLRFGELAGCTVDCYTPAKRGREPEPATLEITASIRRRVVEDEDGELYYDGREVAETKTRAGERIIVLDRQAAAIVERRIAASKARGELSLFPAVWGGPVSDSTTRQRWYRMLELAAELGAKVPKGGKTKSGEKRYGLTPHGLRRSWFSYRHKLNHDGATVAKEGGHTDAVTGQRIYTESVSDMPERARMAAELGAFIAKAARPVKAV